jgi:hypothetical protein
MMEAHKKAHRKGTSGALWHASGTNASANVRRQSLEGSAVRLSCGDNTEPMTGIEPAYSAWEVDSRAVPAFRMTCNPASLRGTQTGPRG